MKLTIIGLFLHVIGGYCFIIPDEIPSLLSVIYSNIPTIKKGTDSRLGWGFRLGDRADFQVLVELGPQTYTQPLGNQGDKDTTNKRNTLNNLSNTLYAKRQQEKKEKKEVEKAGNSKWLEDWNKGMKELTKVEEKIPSDISPLAKPGLGIGEIDAKSVIPADDGVIPFINSDMKKSKLSAHKDIEEQESDQETKALLLAKLYEQSKLSTKNDKDDVNNTES